MAPGVAVGRKAAKNKVASDYEENKKCIPSAGKEVQEIRGEDKEEQAVKCLPHRRVSHLKSDKIPEETKPIVANSLDGVTENIPEHFKTIYSDLFNSVDDANNMAVVSEAIVKKVNSKDIVDIEKVTPDVAKKAAAKQKPGKGDSVYKLSSDCVKIDSKRLTELLAAIFQSFLDHGRVTRFLLLVTLVPIIKDKLRSINNSKNYRIIAISNVILKFIDWIINILFGDTLGLNDLQFAYQPGVSGNMCIWAILEMIDYFLRHGSEVFACTMDMTRSFDVTMHSEVFRR